MKPHIASGLQMLQSAERKLNESDTAQKLSSLRELAESPQVARDVGALVDAVKTVADR